MANKKYKLTDGNYWATDGVYDFDQGKTQREVNSDLSGAINDKILYFTSQAVSATTGNILDISNAKITADYVLLECTFATPTNITTKLTWTTSAGHFILNGTCTSATTANVTLGKKGN